MYAFNVTYSKDGNSCIKLLCRRVKAKEMYIHLHNYSYIFKFTYRYMGDETTFLKI